MEALLPFLPASYAGGGGNDLTLTVVRQLQRAVAQRADANLLKRNRAPPIVDWHERLNIPGLGRARSVARPSLTTSFLFAQGLFKERLPEFIKLNVEAIMVPDQFGNVGSTAGRLFETFLFS